MRAVLGGHIVSGPLSGHLVHAISGSHFGCICHCDYFRSAISGSHFACVLLGNHFLSALYRVPWLHALLGGHFVVFIGGLTF